MMTLDRFFISQFQVARREWELPDARGSRGGVAKLSRVEDRRLAVEEVVQKAEEPLVSLKPRAKGVSGTRGY